MAVVVPKKSQNRKQRALIVAYITSVWKSNKQPKIGDIGDSSWACCSVSLHRAAAPGPNVASWQAKEDSPAWVLKPETVVAVLAVSEAA